MTHHKSMFGRTVLAAAVLLVLAAGTASATPPAPKVPAPASVKLEYKMPAGRALTYEIKAEESQVMEVMGQSMDTQSTNTSSVTFTAKGLKGKDLLLGVTIDDISVNVASSAQGDMSPDMSSVKGKSFDMVLSSFGSEVDVSGAEAITFTVESETSNISSRFKTFFPDLPGKPVKAGDTWPSSSSTEEKTSSMTIRTDLQYVNTLEGFETVEGMECARIVSQITGTIAGTGSQQGMDLTFSGTSKGKDVWHFAVKEGIYVKAVSEATTQMSIDVPAAGMTIPSTVTTKGDLKLVGRK